RFPSIAPGVPAPLAGPLPPPRKPRLWPPCSGRVTQIGRPSVCGPRSARPRLTSAPRGTIAKQALGGFGCLDLSPNRPASSAWTPAREEGKCHHENTKWRKHERRDRELALGA